MDGFTVVDSSHFKSMDCTLTLDSENNQTIISADCILLLGSPGWVNILVNMERKQLGLLARFEFGRDTIQVQHSVDTVISSELFLCRLFSLLDIPAGRHTFAPIVCKDTDFLCFDLSKPLQEDHHE